MKKKTQQSSVLEEINPDLKKFLKILGIVDYLLQSFVFLWHGLKNSCQGYSCPVLYIPPTGLQEVLAIGCRMRSLEFPRK